MGRNKNLREVMIEELDQEQQVTGFQTQARAHFDR